MKYLLTIMEETYDQGKKITAIDGLRAIRTIIKYKYFSK